ncbi:histidine-rich glycoprotein-like isoform X2 [Oppia nitens]|uniref:histidine-rich glycoprotein-like isoform X2 n=1 Tax=Oppia nitens TaxID=1686743 RepID=UPI0023DB4A30|nr:histidine-rich glycoprotein-like isoform X2 [Oppia nitens]
MTSIKLFNLFAIIYLLNYPSIECNSISNDSNGDHNVRDTKYAGESKQVLNILNDMQTDATHHHPYHHFGHHPHHPHHPHHQTVLSPVTHEGHGSGHNHWDNIDKLWEKGAGAHHSDYDKYGNHGYKQQYVDIGEGYHDRHNDGLNAGNSEGYDDRSLWSRDRGQDHERNMRWDRELEIKKANAGKSGHISKYHQLDNGAHYGLKHIDENNYNVYSGRGRHSGQGWHELDRYRGNKGQYVHGSDYRESPYIIPSVYHKK